MDESAGWPPGWLLPAPGDAGGMIVARRREEVPRLLQAIDRAFLDNRFAAFALAYEAAPVFDAAMSTRAPVDGPLGFCRIFETSPQWIARLPPAKLPVTGAWTPELDAAAHACAVAAIRERIAAGDTYQVNLTFRLRGDAPADPWMLFRALWRSHPVPHAAWMLCDEVAIASLSPELFFAVAGDEIICRPMKGTAPRGRWSEEDNARRRALADSIKDRAENLMIVDMVRNDLGRIARPGTVRADSLFEVETYRSVFQMTSTIRARSDAPPSEILRALFPCASITGAPKVSAMRIIAELEVSPRGFYCGAMGFVAPGRRIKVSVPIRTLVTDAGAGRAEYGVGGGVVWDSTAPSEYDEAFHKAMALLRPDPPFEVLETMRWQRGAGVFLWQEHMARLARSAAYFGFPAPDPARLREQIEKAALATGAPMVRVRLRYDDAGEARLDVEPLCLHRARRPMRVALDDRPTPTNAKWLYHKTTRREIYEAARARHPGADEVILWNAEGEIMEGTIANVLAKLDGAWYTPPIESGLLPGTLRGRLLRRGWARERRITIADLLRAERIALSNSVRGLFPATLSPPQGSGLDIRQIADG